MTHASTDDTRHIQVNGLTFDVEVTGPPDGEPVLLLHGFPQTLRQWRHVCRALAQDGFRAIAPNQRGYSVGARPTEVSAYAMPQLLSDAMGIMAGLGHGTFHVVGHDWGGAVAWGLAGIWPDRVRSLTAISTPHPAALAAAFSDPESPQQAASAYIDVLCRDDLRVADLVQLGHGFETVETEAVQHYLAHVLLDHDCLRAATHWYRANVAGRRVAAAIGPVTIPTLYLWGRSDPTFVRQVAEATREHVAATYTFVPVEGGHFLPETHVEEVLTSLREHLRRHG